MKRIIIGVIAGMLVSVGAVTPAFADSVSASRLPNSTTLEGHVTVGDQDSSCDPASDYCGWYGEASAYHISVDDAETGGIECPDVFDLSHGIWIGNVIDDPTATDNETFAFVPDVTTGPIEICLYTTDATSGDQLDTSSVAAVTKARSSVRLALKWVVGCRVSLYAFVNDGNVVGGNLLFAIKRQGYKTWFVKWPASDDNFWFEWGRGPYKINAKFLGDNVVNSSRWSSVIHTRIRRCHR